jgi:hypothetical protein
MAPSLAARRGASDGFGSTESRLHHLRSRSPTLLPGNESFSLVAVVNENRVAIEAGFFDAQQLARTSRRPLGFPSQAVFWSTARKTGV